MVGARPTIAVADMLESGLERACVIETKRRTVTNDEDLRSHLLVMYAGHRKLQS